MVADPPKPMTTDDAPALVSTGTKVIRKRKPSQKSVLRKIAKRKKR